MEYKEFLEYIYQRHSGNVKLGLDRIQNILKEMNDPNLKLQGIHVAGTNGKGSTSAICEALSISHGLSSGLNTSPHLIDYRERIRLNGINIEFQELLRIYRLWEKILEANSASFFEITTALAFFYFYEQSVESAIFEVGLGGRLDGTNPFASTVSVITSISYDHTKSLGNTIAKIAREKAGITKPDTPLVLGKLSPYAARKVLDNANNKNAATYILGRDFKVNNILVDDKGTTFSYLSPDLQFPELNLNLLGEHQALNAATALTAFHLFMERTGRPIQEDLVRQALQQVKWPGRLQILSRRPTIIIDGAHNLEGVNSLVRNLLSIFPGKRIFFVLAILRDKNLTKMITEICSISHKIYVTKNKSTRAAEIEIQAKIVMANNTEFLIAPDVIGAVKEAMQDADENDLIVISGSLYTISEVIAAQKNLF